MNKWLVVALLLIASAVLLWLSRPAQQQNEQSASSTTLSKILSPVQTPPEQAPTAAEPSAEAQSKVANSKAAADTPTPDTTSAQPGAAAAAGIHPWQVGLSSLSDDDYYRFVDYLKMDPEFLAAVMTEFQGESDAARSRKLAAMLGEVHDPAVRLLAESMVASGNTQTEIAALDLLGNIQQHDPLARQLVLQVIGSRTEEPVLIAALNAMAEAERDIDLAQKVEIANRISPLVQHSEATVRRHSYALLFRWAAELDHLLPQLRQGLSDPDAAVRRSTAFGFADFPQNDEASKQALFSMLNNADEIPRNRKAAASALNRLPLASDETAHIKAMLKQIAAR